jgi:hypothetical protein
MAITFAPRKTAGKNPALHGQSMGRFRSSFWLQQLSAPRSNHVLLVLKKARCIGNHAT